MITLAGYSFGKGRFHLVYDYMTNGSLEQHLFPEANRGSTLSWSLRHSIVKDVAQGLYQLHVTGAPHGSIGASSIMLDHDSTAHLDDHFGYRPERIASGGGGDASALADRDAALQEDIADLGALVMELVSGRRRHSTAVVVGNATTTTPLDHWVRTQHGKAAFSTPSTRRWRESLTKPRHPSSCTSASFAGSSQTPRRGRASTMCAWSCWT